MMRISVSSLDSWRYYLASESMTEEAFIDDLLNRKPPRPAQRRGTAFHLLLEALHASAWDGEPPEGVALTRFGGFVRQDPAVWRFELGGAEIPCPAGEREISGRIDVPGADFLITGRADLVTAGAVIDYKTSTKEPDWETRSHSLQWRAYLDMFSRDQFTYYAFQLKPRRRGSDHEMNLINLHRFDLWQYAGMRDDVIAVAHDLADFRRSRGLENLRRHR